MSLFWKMQWLESLTSTQLIIVMLVKVVLIIAFFIFCKKNDMIVKRDKKRGK